jgi:hypothetical protein
MQINLLEKTLQNVDRDACPKIALFIFFLNRDVRKGFHHKK